MAYLGKTENPSYFFGADETTLNLAKRLRRTMTPCEKLLWNRLKAKNIAGAKFRRQHPIKFFIADFYCHEVRIVIEVDGPIHTALEHIEYDANRDAEMDTLGIRVMRFTNDEIKYHTCKVIRLIKALVIQRRHENK